MTLQHSGNEYSEEMSIDLEIEWFLNKATGALSEHIQRYRRGRPGPCFCCASNDVGRLMEPWGGEGDSEAVYLVRGTLNLLSQQCLGWLALS
jgi:hypothetical protein